LINDTIGFIRDLPPALLESFRSTLEDSVEAGLLLHVVDAADPLV
jgi:GTP-binding protein HflX